MTTHPVSQLTLGHYKWINKKFIDVAFTLSPSGNSVTNSQWWQTQLGQLLPIWQYQPSQGIGQLLIEVDQVIEKDLTGRQITVQPAPDPTSGRTIHYILSSQASIGCALFAARQCRYQTLKPLLLAEHLGQLPVAYQPSFIVVDGMPPGVTAAIILLEDWAIPSRLSCPDFRPGCFQGTVKELFAYSRQLRSLQPRNIISFTDYNDLQGCFLKQDKVSYHPVIQYSQLEEVMAF